MDNFKRLMNIADVIDDLKYLKLIVYFNDFTAEEIEKLNEFNHKIEICSLKNIMVKYFGYNWQSST